VIQKQTASFAGRSRATPSSVRIQCFLWPAVRTISRIVLDQQKFIRCIMPVFKQRTFEPLEYELMTRRFREKRREIRLVPVTNGLRVEVLPSAEVLGVREYFHPCFKRDHPDMMVFIKKWTSEECNTFWREKEEQHTLWTRISPYGYATALAASRYC
jgi:hypothetical protein